MNCSVCHRVLVECVSCKRLVCSNCNIVEFVNTPVVKGWVCYPCLGGDTEVHKKLVQFSEEHGSPDKLILKYTQTTLF